MDRIQISGNAAKAVDAYIEYNNIVGNLDGGKMLSPQQYEEFKQQMALKQQNRLYVYWRSTSNLDCKVIGPYCKCFCGHKFKEHESCDRNKQVKCLMKKCVCVLFQYVPVYGSADLKCLCKHSYLEHNAKTKKCEKTGGRCTCSQFKSTHSCSCGLQFGQHRTIFETREEREAQGLAVDSYMNFAGQQQQLIAMGGLTDFYSIADGVERQKMIEGASNKKMIQQGKKQQQLENQEQEEDYIEATPYQMSQLNQKYNPAQMKNQQNMQEQIVVPEAKNILQLYNTPHKFGSYNPQFEQYAQQVGAKKPNAVVQGKNSQQSNRNVVSGGRGKPTKG